METYRQIIDALYAAVDKKYDEFNNPIVNSDYPTIGVRSPELKRIVKSVPLGLRDGIIADFLADENKIYETVMVAGMLAAKKGDYGKTLAHLKTLVPLFGSWAHIDCVTPCLSWADRAALWNDFRYLLDCDGQYEKRFYIMIMFSCCLSDEYIDDILETLVGGVKYGQYYVDMAAAWLLAECLVKYRDKTLPLFTSPTFPKFVHNKALQKARESFRIDAQTKGYLQSLKIKK